MVHWQDCLRTQSVNCCTIIPIPSCYTSSRPPIAINAAYFPPLGVPPQPEGLSYRVGPSRRSRRRLPRMALHARILPIRHQQPCKLNNKSSPHSVTTNLSQATHSCSTSTSESSDYATRQQSNVQAAIPTPISETADGGTGAARSKVPGGSPLRASAPGPICVTVTALAQLIAIW